jgi:hypothetical protein
MRAIQKKQEVLRGRSFLEKGMSKSGTRSLKTI